MKSAYWVHLSQEHNPRMVSKSLNFTRRLIFLTFNNEILVAIENPKEYVFLTPKVVGEGFEKLLEKKKKKIITGLTSKAKASTKDLLEIVHNVSIKTALTKIVIENNEENMIFLKFGKDVLSIKFWCDFSREKFKQEIMQDLPLEEWKRSFKNMGLSFLRKSKSVAPPEPQPKRSLKSNSDFSMSKSLTKSVLNKSGTVNKSVLKKSKYV